VTTGERRLRVLALGGADMAGVVEGLAGAIGAHTADGAQVDVVQEPSPDAGALAAHLEGRAGLEDFDVVMLSVGCGLGAPTEALGSLRAAVDAAKARGATVLLLNGSSVVPGEDRAAARATSLGIARLNHSGFELSVATGASIIDADRTLAELGADEHVTGALSYSPVAYAALRDELVRVLDDYGFFDDRPVLAQVGHRSRR